MGSCWLNPFYKRDINYSHLLYLVEVSLMQQIIPKFVKKINLKLQVQSGQNKSQFLW